MSTSYQSVLWNRQKRIYDLIILISIITFFLVFILLHILYNPEVTLETLLIRATGLLAFFMLHVILSIGPLSRLNTKFLPLLYNRRHLGVTMFLVAATHGILNLIQFHSGGNKNPFLSLFISNPNYTSISNFPFQTLGFLALIILFLMAVSSHDFWLKNLSPKVWKSLHMMVYLVYFLVVLHVMLGVVQAESSYILVISVGVGMTILIFLHLMAGNKENALLKSTDSTNNVKEEFVYACDISDIIDNRAKVLYINDENIAIFKYESKLSAISNICKHQNGPLGEGKIVDGCVTCPWHGYQYLPNNGCSPPPFTEKVATYDLKLKGPQVWVNPNPFPEGTERSPIIIVDE